MWYKNYQVCCIASISARSMSIYGINTILTHHWGRVTHICGGNLTIIASDNGLAPSHYLNQCWNIVDWTLRNTLQWNFNGNYHISIEQNVFKRVVCEMASIFASASICWCLIAHVPYITRCIVIIVWCYCNESIFPQILSIDAPLTHLVG